MSDVSVVEIVIPVKNEQHALVDQVTRLLGYLRGNLPCAWQVTIADNGSTDGTWSLAQDLAQAHPGQVRAVYLDRPGRGRALHLVWSASDADVVAAMDLGQSTDLAALVPLVAPLRLAPGGREVHEGHIMHGVRGGRGGRGREVVARAYSRLLRVTLRAGFSDAPCGFKALRAETALALLPLVEDRAWFFDTELLVLAERSGYRIAEVPVDWTEAGSPVRVVATALSGLRGIWRLGRGLPLAGAAA